METSELIRRARDRAKHPVASLLLECASRLEAQEKDLELYRKVVEAAKALLRDYESEMPRSEIADRKVRLARALFQVEAPPEITGQVAKEEK